MGKNGIQLEFCKNRKKMNLFKSKRFLKRKSKLKN